LLVVTGANENLERASRNIEGVTLVPANALVTYDLMRHDRLMLSKEAAERLSRALSLNPEAAPAGAEPGEGAAEKKAAPAKAESKKAAPKAAKKPAAAKSAKPKTAAKPKAKKE
jgi:Ribosomal protein L4/L1 family